MDRKRKSAMSVAASIILCVWSGVAFAVASAVLSRVIAGNCEPQWLTDAFRAEPWRFGLTLLAISAFWPIIVIKSLFD